MVGISNSPWVKPTTNLMYEENGEAKFFPPLRTTARMVARALTFEGWPRNGPPPALIQANFYPSHVKTERADDNNAFSTSHYDCPENQCSVLLTSDTSRMDIDDPPDGYESFEHDCIQQSFSKDEVMYLEDGIFCKSMSTPTECYSSKLRQRPTESPKLHIQRQATLSSAEGSCPSSPLIQTGPTAYLPLDELVEIYTKQMETARRARAEEQLKSDDATDFCDNKPLTGSNLTEQCSSGQEEEKALQLQSQCQMKEDEADKGELAAEVISNDQENQSQSATVPMQLVVLDIQLLLQRLNNLFGNSSDSDVLRVPVEELESLLASCHRNSDDPNQPQLK